MTSYRAVVVGATGAVGSALVRELLTAPRCEAVTILTRRKVDVFAGADGVSKLIQRVVNMDDLEAAATEAVRGCEIAFCTMGIGQPRKASREELWRVDVEYAGAFARGCKQAGVRHISLLGAAGADAGSRSYYMRAKGSAEEAVRAPGFARCSFFRPSLLVTRDIRYGLQDRVTQAVFPRLSWALPSRWHEIRVEDLARAMRVNAEHPPGADAVEVLHYDEFLALLQYGRLE
jgi:uncharacterized protein YbjT (DUF2867 family)